VIFRDLMRSWYSPFAKTSPKWGDLGYEESFPLVYSKKEQVKTFLQGEAKLDGFMLTGHVCMVMGYEEYESFPIPQKKILWKTPSHILCIYMGGKENK